MTIERACIVFVEKAAVAAFRSQTELLLNHFFFSNISTQMMNHTSDHIHLHATECCHEDLRRQIAEAVPNMACPDGSVAGVGRDQEEFTAQMRLGTKGQIIIFCDCQHFPVLRSGTHSPFSSLSSMTAAHDGRQHSARLGTPCRHMPAPFPIGFGRPESFAMCHHCEPAPKIDELSNAQSTI